MKKVFLNTAFAIGLATSLGAYSLSAHAVNLVVFGDSLSDTGNNRAVIAQSVAGAGGTYAPTPASAITSNGYIPSIPYASGNYTNGDVWSDIVAARLGSTSGQTPSLLGGTNYAFGGARTGGATNNGFPFPTNLVDQVNSYLTRPGGGGANASDIYVIAGGGNNARDTVDRTAPIALAGGNVSNIIAADAAANAGYVASMISQLRSAGAQRIIVWNTPNLGATPAAIASGAQGAGFATLVSQGYNQALTQALAGVPVTIFDVFGSVSTILGSGAFSNTTNACVINVCTNPDTYAFYDGIHPSAAAHRVIANLVTAVIPVPGVAPLLALGLLLIAATNRRRA